MQKQGNALTVDKAALMQRKKILLQECSSHWNSFGPSVAVIMSTVAYTEHILAEKTWFLPRNKISTISNARYALGFSEVSDNFPYKIFP